MPGCQELFFSLSFKAKRPGTRPTKQTESLGDHSTTWAPEAQALAGVVTPGDCCPVSSKVSPPGIPREGGELDLFFIPAQLAN